MKKFGNVRCDCGYTLELQEFTNTCACGRDYSFSGSLLAPRSHWGEETGETANDILNDPECGHYDASIDVDYEEWIRDKSDKDTKEVQS